MGSVVLLMSCAPHFSFQHLVVELVVVEAVVVVMVMCDSDNRGVAGVL